MWRHRHGVHNRGVPFFDGVSGQIHYRSWRVDDPAAGLIFLHGRGQHSGDYHRFARLLNRSGIEMWALDHVGHGLSEGELGNHGSIEDLAANAETLAGIARAERPQLPLVLMGHSLGAATALSVEPHGFAALVLCGTPKAATAGQQPDLPTLVVHGVDDRLTPIDPIREWVAGLPSAHLLEYPDAGHDLLHERVHREVTAAVAGFIRERRS